VFALLFLAIYSLGRFVLHDRATAILDARVYGGSVPVRVAAFPGPANPLRWRGLAETREAYHMFDLNLFGRFDPDSGQVFLKAARTPAIDAADGTATFREYLTFPQFPLWRALPAADLEGGTRVEVMDLRFGTPLSPAFVCTAILDSQLRVIRSWFQFGATSPH
ncbi:MAG: hypothetical protein M3Z85_17270, partial [Acidobacteriota bacterium]|nr:hypothetical protein [Acidobacteriota bacterium]